MDRKAYPQYDDDAYNGDEGVRLVDGIVSKELKWIFRPTSKIDLGIDGQIEQVTPEKRGTGRLIAAQIKCGQTFFNEPTEMGWLFRGKAKHFNYWIDHSLPVIVIICNPDTNQCFWQEVSSSNVEILDKGWKVVIPKTNQLGTSSREALSRIAGRPEHGDIVKALFYELLNEKYRKKIEICTIYELPRDYHKYAFLSKIDKKIVMIDIYHDRYGLIQAEDLDEIIRWKEYNSKQCGSNRLDVYVSSESKKALIFSEEVKKYIASIPGLIVYPVLYKRHPLLSLTELDENGNHIEYWNSYT